MQDISQNHFRIISIRPITPPQKITEDENVMKQVHSIQKAVYGKEWLYLYKGYKFVDIALQHADGTSSESYGNYFTVDSEDHDDEMLYSTPELCVSVSAIVGENGSGKSSTVELMVRLINNFAAALMGEGNRNVASEHLYYIDYVYGCMVFQTESRYFRLCVEDREVTLGEYHYNKDLGRYELNHSLTPLIDKQEKDDRKHPIKGMGGEVKWLDKLFYTVIYNYSMYAFNFNDYREEQTKEDRWGKWKKKELTQDKVWLKGLFHKNDGYQTPVVLNPMRDNGLIDISNENKLTRERLLSMLFYREKNANGNKTVYPFRTINQTKEIVGLKINYYDSPNYDRNKVVDHLNLKADRFMDEFEDIRKDIIELWCEIAQITDDESTKDNKLAWDYVVYKTLKISKNYNRYYKINRNLRKDYKKERLRKHINELYADRSHVTVKLRRALFFLKTRIFRNKGQDVFWLNDVERWMEEADLKWENATFKIKEMHLIVSQPDVTEHDEMLPPPIYDISLIIVDKDKIDKNGFFDQNEAFPIDGLSSGEKQLAGVVSNFVYHLVNINSVWKYDHVAQTKEEELVKYKYVNVVFDEVELYFHPDLQRRFMKIMTDALHNITLEYIKAINILIVTHSPFVLSDIPSSNVLFLRANEKNNTVERETFASNIHQLLGSSFFMEYAIGDVAREALQDVYGLYAKLEDKAVANVNKHKWLENEAYYKYVGSIISDDYLRNSFQIMCQELMNGYHPEAAVEEERAALRARLAELEKKNDD